MVDNEDVSIAAKRYDIELSHWMDLSTTINPNGYPIKDLPIDVFHRLPTNHDGNQLERIARSAYGVPNGAGLISAAGCQVLIQMLPQLKAHRHVAIVGPTNSSHSGAWRAAGHRVEEVDSLDNASRSDVVIVVNPNNFDSQYYSPAALKKLADRLYESGGLLIIDEAHMDAVTKKSFIKYAELPNVIILRSLGKFYGLSGLRLGFAIGSSRHLGIIREMLGPWAVSGPAIHIGCSALTDQKWHKQMRQDLEIQTTHLGRVLSSRHIKSIGCHPLFHLIEVVDARTLHHQLANRAIWTRQFEQFPTWLRIGLPKSRAHFKRLEASLDEIIEIMPVAA